jgi:Histidine phosphatase superfamily (branch 1)
MISAHTNPSTCSTGAFTEGPIPGKKSKTAAKRASGSSGSSTEIAPETRRSPHDSNFLPRSVAVGHGDVIRAALLHYLGLSLDGYARIEISPAGISKVAVGDWG